MLGMLGEALKGHLDLLLLAILEAGPAHGYAVIEALRKRRDQPQRRVGHGRHVAKPELHDCPVNAPDDRHERDTHLSPSRQDRGRRGLGVHGVALVVILS